MADAPRLKPLDALRRSLRMAPAHDAIDGFYDVITNERVLRLGRDSTDPVARMVAVHEHFHAVLNAGTTFGTCLVLAGTLAEAGIAGFENLTERLIDACMLAHETYATLGSAYAVSKGPPNMRLLDGFPDYLELAYAFREAVDLPMQSYVETVCLDACVRAAMQTNLAEHWMALPCEMWLVSPLDGVQRPDVRFGLCVQRDSIAALIDAIGNALREIGGPLGRLTQPIDAGEEAALLSNAPAITFEKVQRAGFDALARHLADAGAPTLRLDGNRIVALALTAKVQAFAGERLKRDFVVPWSRAEDHISALLDLRRERITLRPDPDSTVLVPYPEMDSELGRVLVRSSSDRQFIQLVAMPRAKCRSLYRARVGGELLSGSDSHLTAVRRRLAPAPAYPDGLIVLVTLDDRDQLSGLSARLGGPRIRAIVSATTYEDDTWREEWLSAAESTVVVIDRDPFALMRSLAKGRRIELAKIAFEWVANQERATTEIVVLSAPDDPRRAFVTPCSSALFEGMATIALFEIPNVSLRTDLTDPVKEIVAPALSHILIEEGRFGFDFWE